MSKQADIYRELLSHHPVLRSRFDGVDLSDEGQFKGLRRYYGQSASMEEFFLEHRYYDFIVSRAVMEHVTDPVVGLERMSAALLPCGMMLHKVDLRDHGMFSQQFHELKFLEVPEWAYRRMVQASGGPNRIMIDQYRAALSRLGLEYSLFITRLAGVGDITPHLPYEVLPKSLVEQSLGFVRSVRHRFCKEMQGLSDEDLSVGGIFMVARKARHASEALVPTRS